MAHMMRRLRLNFYRAEDMMFIMRKREWAREDEEFAKEQKRRAKEKRARLIKKNKARRRKTERNADKDNSDDVLIEVEKDSLLLNKEDSNLKEGLLALLQCPLCPNIMSPPAEIYQCKDGHILCRDCRYAEKNEVGFLFLMILL